MASITDEGHHYARNEHNDRHHRRPRQRAHAAACNQHQQQHPTNFNQMSPILFVATVALLLSVAEGGSMSGGRNVPWWYPSRIWGGGDRDGGGRVGRGWNPYSPTGDGSTKWSSNGEVDTKGKRNAQGSGTWDGSAERARETSHLAKEFVENCVAFGLAEEEERAGLEPRCSIYEGGNSTLRRLGNSIDRCAAPDYSLTEIYPSQLVDVPKLNAKVEPVRRYNTAVYTDVDPETAAREAEEAERKAAEARRTAKQRKGKHPGEEGDDADEYPPVQDDTFLGIFLFLEGDYFSIELENALAAIAPAYPRSWLVKANAKTFLSFCVQYHLYTFPQVLLFKNGRFISKFRGRRSPQELAAWLSLQTDDLPSAIPRRAVPPPPLPPPLTLPRADEPLAWIALLYGIAKIYMAMSWIVKRRGGAARGPGDTGDIPGGFMGRVKRVGAWVVSVLFLRRWRTGGGVQRRHCGGTQEGGGGGVGVMNAGGGGDDASGPDG